MSLTLQLPLPDAALSPNARCHWSRKMAATKAARTAAKLEAYRALGDARIAAPRWARARYRATFYYATLRRRDKDNLIASLKAYLDGIADADVVLNDEGLTPEPPEIEQTERMPRVEITIEPES